MFLFIFQVVCYLVILRYEVEHWRTTPSQSSIKFTKSFLVSKAFKTFSNLFIIAVYNIYQHMQFLGAIDNRSQCIPCYSLHTNQNKPLSRRCCYCRLYPCKVSSSLLQGFASCTELHQPNSRCFGRVSAIVC